MAILLGSLPPAVSADNLRNIRELLARGQRKAVVLDDDPTGTQTVHGVDVLASWGEESLAAALSDPRPCFYVLTNTRSLPEAEAAARVREIAANLKKAARATGIKFSVISRSDSTLRGHFAAELGAIEEGLGFGVDGKIVIPAFFEGGRYTLGNVHYVAEGETLVPAAETEFAKDATFGYAHSDLTRWVEEKTGGSVKAGDVASIDIAELRGPRGLEAVKARLLSLTKGAFLVVNAAAYSDLEVFTLGLLQAEGSGKSYLLRTAASFVRVRAGQDAIPLLKASDILGKGPGGGLVVVGSYVKKTTVQLEALLGLREVEGIELAVDRLADPTSGAEEILRATSAATAAMASGRHAVVFTSRKQRSAVGAAGELGAGRIVSQALVEIVRGIANRPRFMISKGGITSNDVAIHGLGMLKATVLGQASPGVPVWEMGPETRFPGMNLVIWPGNVGSPESLRDLVRSA